MRNEIRNRVCMVLSDVLQLPLTSIKDDTSAQSTVEWDSLNHLNLVLALEQEFQVRFSPEQIEKMTDVTNVTTIIDTVMVSNS